MHGRQHDPWPSLDGGPPRPLRALPGAALLLVWLAASAQAQLTTGMWAYYDFEAGTISNVAPGSTNYGVATNGTPESGWVGGTSAGTDRSTLLAGNALNLIRTEADSFQLNGIGSGALAPTGANLNGTFTISAWHYLATTDVSTASRFFVWENTTDFDLSWGTGGGTTGPDGYAAYNTSAVVLGSASLSRNQWNHVAQTFTSDGTNVIGSLYVNGTLRGTTSALLANMNWSGLRFGNSRGAGGRAWDGLLDEVAIWNTALTGAQVEEAYVRGLQATGLTAATTGVGSWSTSATTNSWTAAGNWNGGAAIGQVGAAAGSSNAVAIFGTYALPTGLGIDMSGSAANGALGLGAIVVDSTSGPLRIGNSSGDTNGVLRLNGATTGAGFNTLIEVSGASDLVVANSPDSATPGSTTLGVTLGIANGTISIGSGRTATIESAIAEATAGSGFTKVGDGTLRLSGVNTFTGTTAISAGTVRLGSSNRLADTSSLALSGGTFDLDSFNETLATVSMTGPASITGSGTLTAATLGVSNATGTATVSAGLSGATAVAKTGAGTLLLSGTNSHTGGTAVSEGIAILASPASLSAGGTTTVAAAATLGLRLGSGFVVGDVEQLFSNTLANVNLDATAIAGADTAGIDATIATPLAGGRGLAKFGAGTLALTAANTYSGGTTIAAGTLAIGGGGTTGSITGNVTNNATLVFNRSDDLIYAGVVSGTGGVTKQGPARLTLTGTNTATGATTVAAGTLDLGGGGTTGSVTGNISNSGSVIFNRSNDLTYAGVVSGSGSVTKQGPGTLTLGGANTYTGGTTIAAGTLLLSGSGTTSVTGGMVIQSGAALRFGRGDTWGNHAATTSAPISIQAGGSVQSNGFFNTLVNPTLSGGSLSLTGGASAVFPAYGIKGTVTVSGSTASAIATISGSNNAINIGPTNAAGSLTFAVADVTGDATTDLMVSAALKDNRNDANTADLASGLVKTGAGRMVLSATSSYTGGTAINAGTLAANAASALGTAGATVASGATLEIGHANAVQSNTVTPASGSTVSFTAAAGTTYAIGGLAGAANLVATGSTLAIGGNNASTTYSGVLTASGLTKAGTGTLTLTNTGHTLGGVIISGGTLVARSAAALGAGTITLAGGSLNYASAADITNAVALSGSAAANAISFSTEVEYLVIGGGGGGAGRDVGGGGGAGGYRSSVVGELSGRNSSAEPTLFLTPGTFGVVVGAGGAGGIDAANDTQGKQGGSSSFDTITALGGGGGNAYNSPAAANGGSGGGGAGLTVLTGNAGTAGQGFGGGTGLGSASGATYGGAGGGGAGAAGANAASNRAGGNGIASSITGTATTRAGGGGGAGHRTTGNTSLGAGGLGGGGSAQITGGATASGAANTGGGGGASRAAGAAGGAGGSGVVIIRYAGPQAGTGGTVDTTSVPGYTVHSFSSVGAANFVLAPSRTISGTVSGSGGLSFNTPNATLVLSGSGNTFSGGAIVSGGTLRGAAPAAFGTGVATASGGTLDVAHVEALRDATLNAAGGSVAFTAAGTNAYTLSGLSGSGTVNAGANTVVVGANDRSSSFAGTLQAAVLQKTGAGTLVLSGVGGQAATTVSAGAIFAGSNTAFGSAAVTLAGGGLRLAPTASLTNDIVLQNSAATTSIGGVSQVDYLIVAGGGGGGGDNGGAGGGGGVLSGTTAVAATSYPVAVGGGGVGGAGNVRGANGGTSSIFGLAAIGGGGGAGGNAGQGAQVGGSGGGGDGETASKSGAAGTTGQGFGGGSGSTGGGGGGGGAGGAGSSAVGPNGGSGGIGMVSSITGLPTYYAGGGGGGPENDVAYVSPGGLGGGGSGRISRGDDGTSGLGGGGGGGGFSSATSTATGGNGGSGVVIVRYQGTPSATGGTITAGTGSAEGYTLHTFASTGAATLSFTPVAAALAGRISGTGGFTWDTPGTLTLSGPNTFQGGAIVSAGTLVAASASALGSGTATVAAGARLRLEPAAILANPIANLGTGSFLGSLDFAGGGLARTSTAGGSTQATLLAGSSGSAASLNPAIAWLSQTSDTSSDIMRLTNTAGTAQVLSLTYALGVAPATPQDAYLGWFDAGPTNGWVNAVAGNSGGVGGFFQGSWLDYVAANPGATPTSALGTYGHDSTTRTVWAAVNHNSDFAVIVVPEPGTLALVGLGLTPLAALLRRRRASGPSA